MRAHYRDIIIGASIGIGLGLILLVGIALFIGPHYPVIIHTPQPVPPVTATPLPSVTPVAAPGVTSQPTPTLTPGPEIVTYTVQEGDTLFGIALKHGTTVEAIRTANGLTSDEIFPGDVLTIPLLTITLPKSTPFGEGETVIHIVVSGETLWDIANDYGVTVGIIRSANGLTSDTIQVGQKLIIPLGSETPTVESGTPIWRPSILEGDLEAAYPLTRETGQFTVHYQPNSLPARELNTIVAMVETALAHIERTLNVNFEGHFDVYVAGSLFAPPDLALRGRSFSSQRRFFFLYDGTGTPADQQYIVAHELTHLITWNTMGRPASVMLHEGVAVYVGMELVEDEGYIPLNVFCAAYHRIDRLPDLTGPLSFQGHIRDLDAYNAAGCFVKYLIEKYGTDKFAEVYHTGDYYSVYGQDLASLEAEWRTSLESSDYSIPFDPGKLAYYVAEVADAYDRLFVNFTGTTTQMMAYREVDKARNALLQGHFDDTATHLATFDALLAEE